MAIDYADLVPCLTYHHIYPYINILGTYVTWTSSHIKLYFSSGRVQGFFENLQRTYVQKYLAKLSKWHNCPIKILKSYSSLLSAFKPNHIWIDQMKRQPGRVSNVQWQNQRRFFRSPQTTMLDRWRINNL